VTAPNMAHCDAGSGSHPLHQWRNHGSTGAGSTSGSMSKRWNCGRPGSPPATWATPMLHDLPGRIPPGQEIASVTAQSS